MKPKWLIEDDAFPEDIGPFVDAVKKLGYEYRLTTQRHFSSADELDCLKFFPPEDCVVFYGSLELAKKLRKVAKWIPGVYYNVPAFECTAYYAALGRYLLNGNYIMLPFAELHRQKEFLYDKLGQDRAVFIRPNRGDKIFTGKVVFKENFDKDVDLFMFYEPAPDELVVVSEPRNLAYEWRFICVKGEIVAGSQYRKGERVDQDPCYPEEAKEFAEKVAREYKPDIAYVIDVCQTSHGYFRLMEAGCFSCCGLYACDREAVVAAVSEAALKEWQEYQIDLREENADE